MDLPSMSRVTKLPIEVLEERAKTTPVAPGLDNLLHCGAGGFPGDGPWLKPGSSFPVTRWCG